MLYLVKLLYNIESIIGHLRVFVFRFLYIAAKVRKAAGMARLTPRKETYTPRNHPSAGNHQT